MRRMTTKMIRGMTVANKKIITVPVHIIRYVTVCKPYVTPTVYFHNYLYFYINPKFNKYNFVIVTQKLPIGGF